MENRDNAFLGTRQVLLVGLGGVGGKIVNTIMRDLPEERKPYTQAIAIDTDINDMGDLEFVPRENKIVLASSPSSGNAMTIGKYLENNPGASEWFVTEGSALKTLMGQSTKQGAKQIRMVSRLALSATAKYYNLENRINKIVSKLNKSDGTVNRDGLLVMVVCSISGGTGAGTVLQVPMFLEDIITRQFDTSTVSMQCAMLLPNLFNQTQANGNYYKGQVNGYAVMRELQSLNTGKLQRFEYMKDYAEVNGADDRNKAPYSFVLLFDNATSSGATTNGSTDNVHIPNIAKCIAEYVYGPASHKCTSQLDNTLATVYSSGGTAIYRAVGRANLLYPDNIYKQYAVSKWILRSVSEEWLAPDEIADKNYRELVKKLRDEGKKRPDPIEKHRLYVSAVQDENICRGQFYSELRSQVSVQEGPLKKSLAEIFLNGVATDIKKKLVSTNHSYSKQFTNLSNSLKGKSKDTHDNSFDALENAFLDFMQTVGNFVDGVMCPHTSLTAKFLNKETNSVCFYPFVRMRSLHPMALRTFLYQLEANLTAYTNKPIAEYKRENVITAVRNSNKRDIPMTVKAQMDLLAKPYEERLLHDVYTRMLAYIKELIIEIETFFTDLNAIKSKFEGVCAGCFKNLEEMETETCTVVGSREGMIACWNDIESKLGEGSGDEDVIDADLSVEIDKMIYTSYYRWISSSDNASANDGIDVFRPKTDYTKIVSEHLLKNFYKRINEQHQKSFPEDIIKAAIFEAYARRKYREMSEVNPRFDPEDFTYSVVHSEIDFENDSNETTLAADYLKKHLVNVIKKAEPMCGPLYAKASNEDYFARLLYFNESVLSKTVIADPFSESSFVEQVKTDEFIPGVSTSAIDSFTVQIEPLENVNKYQIGCFSYTGGLELRDFANMQDPVSGTYDSSDGRCYYNAYRDYINVVMNTTKDNITPHLHKEWHLAGHLNDITDNHTDSVIANSAKAFVYGFLFDDIIRIKENGYVSIGLTGNKIFEDMPGSINGIIDFSPMTHSEHARFNSSRTETNRLLFEIFQYLRDMPELRTRLIKYGDSFLEKAKANKSGAVFSYSVQPEHCADEEYATIIDLFDGFYQHARFSELHDGMKNDVKTLGYMFNTLCEAAIEVCASIYSSPKDRLEAFSYYVEKLYKVAKCDDVSPNNSASEVDSASVSDESSEYDIMFNVGTIDVETSGANKPFSDKGAFSRVAMKSRMEVYLNKNQ